MNWAAGKKKNKVVGSGLRRKPPHESVRSELLVWLALLPTPAPDLCVCVGSVVLVPNRSGAALGSFKHTDSNWLCDPFVGEA